MAINILPENQRLYCVIVLSNEFGIPLILLKY
jgi:hypothetical protein